MILPMRNRTPIIYLFAVILTVFAGTAFATDRALVLKNICSEDFSEQRSALANLAKAGALGDANTAIWAKTVVDSFEKRTLRCGDTIAVIDASSKILSATSLDYQRASYPRAIPPGLLPMLPEVVTCGLVINELLE